MKWLQFVLAALFFTTMCSSDPEITDPMVEDPIIDTIRLATFNVSMFGNSEGQIADQMMIANQFTRYKRIAAIIQNVHPDVIVLNEFDYDPSGNAIKNFNNNLLVVQQDQAQAIDYEYKYQFSSNTGILSEADLDNNNRVELPGDAYGFGNFEGQYGFAILSQYPIDTLSMRTFQQFKWKDMPEAALPMKSDGSSYYSEDALNVFRLSSKSHVDLPIVISDKTTIHALIAHPTPPVFDGSEDRNGRRNHDEIRLWADYISNTTYLIDDKGTQGGLSEDKSFIIFGDYNADPLDGDSYNAAISLLLIHSRINQEVANGNLIPSSNGGAEHNQRSGDLGDPSYDTSFFGLRTDYVLPSEDLNVIDSGVFWPASGEAGYDIVKNEQASDHLLVWVDIQIER